MSHIESETKATPLSNRMESERRVAGELASIQDRFVAGLIDGLIVGAAASIVTVPILMTGIVPLMLGSALSAAIAFGVFMAANYNLLKNGQTIGKRIMNTKIVNMDGDPAEVNNLMLKRYSIPFLLSAIPYVGPLLAIGNAAMIFRESRACLHDDFAKTKVVNA